MVLNVEGLLSVLRKRSCGSDNIKLYIISGKFYEMNEERILSSKKWIWSQDNMEDNGNGEIWGGPWVLGKM